ncbi:hypothetical protein KZZ10_02240 [Alcaligenaceae bacterium LF4-65]|jgi:hypothetical protein|uniref:Uncharacterized protein n=1 Tax=Zwartia hollandica TaxID=324606 RepID=A0A953N7I3_9BURK|nr:hypothetical protein [Zwartia hollandica]MBZ1349453.1 hypothetical protein [Zwartia hollandica]
MTREVRHNYSPSFVAAHSTAPSLKSKVADVLLLAFWAAMIPGFMWVGSAAGF